jgi:hypothetical protein
VNFTIGKTSRESGVLTRPAVALAETPVLHQRSRLQVAEFGKAPNTFVVGAFSNLE